MSRLGRSFFAILLCLTILLPVAGARAVSRLALEGFYESAFRGEYGDTNRGKSVRWSRPVVIYVKGDYTDEDVAALATLLFDLSKKVKGLPQMSVTTKEKGANVIVSYVPYDQMGKEIKQYVEGNDGFVGIRYTYYKITSGRIAISTDIQDQQSRSAILREEIVNMLGLLNDITCTTDSIICQEGETVTELSAIDYEMLNLLYNSKIPAGTTLSRAKKILGE